MGMHDKPKYLTGKDGDGFVEPGEEFYLHNARLDGTVVIRGESRENVKLLVSHEPDSEKVVVFSSGKAIVSQIKRIDNTDREQMRNGGMHLRLDAIPSGQGNPTNVMTPASDPPRSEFDGGNTEAQEADF